jgi:hypothetical protein
MKTIFNKFQTILLLLISAILIVSCDNNMEEVGNKCFGECVFL